MTRRLRVNRKTTVQVSGVFYYRTIFGKINMGRFTRNVYVPHDTVAVTYCYSFYKGELFN